MIAIPEYHIAVPGFEIVFRRRNRLLSERGGGSECTEDGYLQMQVLNDGTHDFCSEPSYWEVRFVQLRSHIVPELIHNGTFDVMPLPPTYVLQQIRIREQLITHHGYGIWLICQLCDTTRNQQPIVYVSSLAMPPAQ